MSKMEERYEKWEEEGYESEDQKKLAILSRNVIQMEEVAKVVEITGDECKRWAIQLVNGWEKIGRQLSELPNNAGEVSIRYVDSAISILQEKIAEYKEKEGQDDNI